jgi:hypothetical protein
MINLIDQIFSTNLPALPSALPFFVANPEGPF